MISPAISGRWKRLSSIRRRSIATGGHRETGVFAENVGLRRDHKGYIVCRVTLPYWEIRASSRPLPATNRKRTRRRRGGVKRSVRRFSGSRCCHYFIRIFNNNENDGCTKTRKRYCITLPGFANFLPPKYSPLRSNVFPKIPKLISETLLVVTHNYAKPNNENSVFGGKLQGRI